MDTYLSQLGKRALFQDAEYFAALGHLSQIVTEEGDITVLFARLYADQMIAAAEGRRREELPKSLPNLILDYLNELNRNQVTERLPDPIVHRDAQIIAWKCLEVTFKPETADRNEIINAIATLEEQENSKEIAEQHLQYLEGEPLHLIRLVAPAKTRVRFSLDPLAEYLAALYLVEHYQGNAEYWKEFIEQAKIKSDILGNIKGFLLAVRYSCIARPELKIPEFVTDELARLANLDLEVLREEQLRRRIDRLTTSLSSPNKGDRIFAAEELKSIGSSAIKALPALLEAVDDPDQEVRILILKAVANIGSLSESYLALTSSDLTKFISKTMNMFETGNELLEMSAIDALANIGSPAISALEKTLESRNRYVRFRSIETLINLGSTAIPALEKATKNKSSYIRSKATEALEQLKVKEK
jgi:HEAT repeat protein